MPTFLIVRFLSIVLFFAVVVGLTAWAAKAAFPERWTTLRRVFLASFVAGVVGIGVWQAARVVRMDGLARGGATLAAIFLVSATATGLSAFLWGPLGRAARTVGGDRVDPGRRRFLRGAVGAVPVSAAAAGPLGAAAALVPPRVRPVDVKSAQIPAALDGLKILQFTDVHLGTFIDVAHVESAVEAARSSAPDLVVLTGDIADDFTLFPAALAAIQSLKPRLGVHACIGNHEVYRGRDQAIALLKEGGVQFHCDDGVVLEHNGARFYLCGVDDPARLGQEHRPFLQKTVARSLAPCPDDVTCKIVLSHRPEGFEAAAEHGAALTLSGHTHGGQMALFGRSLLEPFLPKSYMLGLYRRGESVLYTSAGLGHWFPFRVNCPCETALVTLRSAAPAPVAAA